MPISGGFSPKHNVKKGIAMKMSRLLLAILLALPLASNIDSTAAQADPWGAASCYCKVAYTSYGDQNPVSILGSNLLHDFGVIFTFSENGAINREACRVFCADKAVNASIFNDPQYWLPKVQCNRMFAAYSALGTSTYKHAQAPTHPNLVQGLKCCTRQASITCHPGASADTNGPGNKDCKRVWCTGTISAQPPNNTAVGAWGFTWGNQIINWETPASFTPAATLVFGDPQCS